ncbi:LOW QUALITY PROTEIN: death ligand signal enhancer [Lates calcarifer]|uniref:LOW QUALITY PROTEIN: death ligand signal enhancer n=1 Tax=Lates calcarifer TaxID=8187 RepID=A0AAJ7QG43_LATCA|nr:LOW QUALITY PROTEIN: death ligand signal enhancer [Lates calcarifer]
MWRVQGFVGRVLHRFHGSTTLRLPQNHHVEDEVINSSTVLSTSRHSSDSSTQKEQDGERRRRQRTFQFGWPSHDTDVSPQGAAAVLFMQICRRIHSQFSSGTEPSPTPGALTAPGSLQKCGYRILLEILSRRNVLPRGGSVLCLQGVPERQNQDQTETQSSSSSTAGDAALHSSSEHLTADSSISDHQRAHLNQDLPTLDLEELLLSASCPLQNDTNQDNTETTDANDKDQLSDEERLTGATLNLRHVGDSSVPVILNIIGIESAKSEDYKEAFTCFLAAAQQGYSKAQFNVGVCYEKGRGVGKDREKALYYYQQAATGGHAQAQYRYAKLLLTSGGQQSLEVLDTVIDLLQQAAAAGLTKAQVCLASVYSQESVRDWSKSVQYLKMAAESGDDAALLFLGQCYESGLGVQQNLRIAIEFYRRAAQAGNRQAKSLLTPPNDTDRKAQDAVLRSIRSDPCFFLANRQLQQPPSSLAGRAHPSPGHPTTLPLLPHSWSTGNLGAPSPLSPTPLHLLPHGAEGGTCRWTVGIG